MSLATRFLARRAILGALRQQPPLIASALLAVVLGLAAANARADGSRVALVNPSDALETAVRETLEPWQLDVAVVPPPAPGAVMPGSGDEARVLAARHRAAAVVWISEAPGGHTIWVYDTEEDRVVARALRRPPPFDDATAAAVALTIKTLLRHSTAAPASERWPTEPRPAAEASPGTRGLPRRDIARSGRSTLTLRTSIAGRQGRTRPDAFEPRLSLGVGWRPLRDQVVGAVLDIVGGPGVGADSARFGGRLIDAEAVLALAVRLALGRVLAARGELGAGAQLTLLDGVVLETSAPVEVWRVNPVVRLLVGVDLPVTSALDLGLRGGLSWLVRTQRYLVGGNTVLELSPWALEIVLGTEVAI